MNDGEQYSEVDRLTVSSRLANLEAKCQRLEKEVENMSYMLVGVALILFVLFRTVAFREEVPGLEP